MNCGISFLNISNRHFLLLQVNVPRPESETKLIVVGQKYISPGKTAEIEFNATDSSERKGFQLEFRAGKRKWFRNYNYCICCI